MNTHTSPLFVLRFTVNELTKCEKENRVNVFSVSETAILAYCLFFFFSFWFVLMFVCLLACYINFPSLIYLNCPLSVT